MKSDELSAAVRAFRDEHQGATLSSSTLRDRVLASIARQRRWNSWRIASMVPVAALMVGSAALGAIGHWSKPDIAHVLAHFRSNSGNGTRNLERNRERERDLDHEPIEPVLPIAAPPPVVLTASVMAPQHPTPPKPQPPAHRPAAVAQPDDLTAQAENDAANQRAASAVQLDSKEVDLYQNAHRMHYDGSDPTRAIVAWEDYLSEFPEGKLAVDARYNLALCLIKSGRTADAERALEPFAAGSYGSYRRSEAGVLLRLLRENSR